MRAPQRIPFEKTRTDMPEAPELGKVVSSMLTPPSR